MFTLTNPIYAGRILLLALLPTIVGCERELLVLDPSLQIQGYEVRGAVRDRFGNPISDVDVTVDYILEYADDGPEPPRTYQVQPPGEAITVGVVNRNGQFIYTYAAGTVGAGPFTYRWDKRDAQGNPAPPGVYHIRYTAAVGVRLAFPVLVSGTRAAVTDSLGRYTIRDMALPVDFYPIPNYSRNDTTYYGNLRVTSEVVLGFLAHGIEVYRTLQLIRDRAVIFDARLD